MKERVPQVLVALGQSVFKSACYCTGLLLATIRCTTGYFKRRAVLVAGREGRGKEFLSNYGRVTRAYE